MQNQNQRMLLDNIETMVWYAVDPETYGMVNRARAEFIGKRREELEGKKLREVVLVKEEFENCLASNTAAFEGKETVHAEEWITTSKGKRLVSVTKTPMLDENGNVKFVVCTGIDITENKKAMNGLELANKKLNLYGSMLRHDTLNKLSVIAANVGLAEEQIQDPRLKRYLENILGAVKAIVTEMEFAKEYQNVGVKAPVWNDLRRCVSKASIGLDLRDISLTVDLDDMEILADPMLDRVFHNLIDNACRHGGEVKTINIRHERSGDNLKLICEDDGVGVTEKNKEELFSPGHALQMVRDILTMTEMTIAEKGESGKGARFEICVPASNFRFIN
jgi:PAS domain S-box-containing protein